MTAADIHRAIDAVWRIESPRIIAGLARMVRDVGVAEDLAQDALVAALEQWPQSGVPDNPGAWLMAAAKHRAIDHFRRNARLERKHEELGREMEEKEMAVPDFAAALDDNVGDDLLRLSFYLLPSGASERRACGAYIALARRIDHGGNRAGVFSAGADCGAAHCAGEADAC